MGIMKQYQMELRETAGWVHGEFKRRHGRVAVHCEDDDMGRLMQYGRESMLSSGWGKDGRLSKDIEEDLEAEICGWYDPDDVWPDND